MTFKNIILLLSVLFAFGACSDDTNPILTLPEPYTLDKLESGVIVITDNNLDQNVLSLKWTGENSAAVAPMRYGVQIDLAGTDFKTAQILTETTEMSYSINGKELNDFLIKKFRQDPQTTVRYQIRVVGIVKGKDEISLVYPETASEEQQLIITTVESKSAPENLYMIGLGFGNWNWTSEDVVEMVPVHGTPDEFWAVKYIKAGEGFKWSPVKEWEKGDFNQLDEIVGYTVKDGNAVVDKDGLYMIHVNYQGGIITVEEATISGMGDCFKGNEDNWTEGTNVFEIKDNLASITTKTEGELRICATTSASKTDWWQREFIILDGKIVYRGNGDDQDRVKVAAGKKVTLDFNKNIGTIE